MPLSNSQYDEIMRDYNQRQLENRHIQDARRTEVYRKIPRLREIDSSVASIAVQKARLFLNGTDSAMGDLKDIMDIRSKADTREQEARIANLERQARADVDKDQEITVRLTGGLESYGQ